MFFSPKPLTFTSARNAALVNLLVTPGFGTLMVGKIAVGLAQLTLAFAGFGGMLVWFGAVMWQYYGQISGNVEVKPVGWIGIVGAGLFLAAWLWSLATSIGLIRQARRRAVAEAAPPVISP